MLGQAQTPRRRVLSFAVFGAIVLSIPAVGGAAALKRAAAQRALDTAAVARPRSPVLDLYSLDRRVAVVDGRLTALAREAAALRGERDHLRLELRVARIGTARAERALAQRVRDLYEQGDVEPVDVLVGSRNLDEAMSSLDDLARVSSDGKRVVAQLRAARHRAAVAAGALARRETALAAAKRSAKAAAASLAAACDRRAEYIASLAATRHLRAVDVAVTRARAAVARTPPAASVHASRTLTVTATAYALRGVTSTGLPVGFGVAAVDPSVIPLGTHFLVPGYGEAVAADTGPGVVGAAVDLWFPTAAAANAWGRRTVTVVLR